MANTSDTYPKNLAPRNTTLEPHKAEQPITAQPFVRGVTGTPNPATHTVMVHVDGRGEIELPLPSTTHDSDMRGGSVFLPKPGSPVMLGVGPGNEMFIINYIKDGSSSKDNAGLTPGDSIASTSHPMVNPSIGGAQDPVHSLGGTDSRREGDPGDAGPGDWMMRGSDGNGIGVLEGGVNIFKAGDLSQILGFKVGDLLRVVAKNFELFTGMGEFKISTENGKASLEFKGSTEAQKAHPSAADWNIEAGIGGDANLFYLRFLNPGSGKIKAGITITKDGDILLEGRTISEHEGALKTSGKRTRHGNNEQIRNSDTKEVGDTYARTAKTITRKAASGMKDEAGSSYSLNAGDISVNASHASAEFISGYRPEKDGVPVPGQVPGKTFTIANGNFEVDAGNPLNGGLPATYPCISLRTYTGDIDFTSNVAGSITLNTTPVPSATGLAGPFGIVLNSPMVMLGGAGSPLTPFTNPGMAACKYEALLAYVTALHTALAAHIHPTLMGPSSPSPDLIASLTGVVTPLVAPIMSTTTRIYL